MTSHAMEAGSVPILCRLCKVSRVAEWGQTCAGCGEIAALNRVFLRRRDDFRVVSFDSAKRPSMGSFEGFGVPSQETCSDCWKLRPVAVWLHHRFGGRLVWRVDERPEAHDAGRWPMCLRCARRALRAAIADQAARGDAKVFVSRAARRLVGVA